MSLQALALVSTFAVFAVGCASSANAPAGFPASISARAADRAREPFAKRETAHQTIDVVPNFVTREPAIWRIAHRLGLTKIVPSGSDPFTAKARAASEDCASNAEPHCRRFTIASRKFVRASAVSPGFDPTGEVDGAFVRADIVAAPVSDFGSAIAAAGALSCLRSDGPVPWRGSATVATTVVALGFAGDFAPGDEKGMRTALDASRPEILVECPFERDRLNDNRTNLDTAP